MLDKIKEMLRSVRLYHTANELTDIVEHSKKKDFSYLEFLSELLKHETSCRQKTRLKRYLKLAGLPTIRSIDEFDFHFQTSITKKEVNEWLTFTWIDQRENKILMGPPGVGKTHLSLGVGYSAIHNGYKVLFHTMQSLMEEMILAEQNGQFKDFL